MKNFARTLFFVVFFCVFSLILAQKTVAADDIILYATATSYKITDTEKAVITALSATADGSVLEQIKISTSDYLVNNEAVCKNTNVCQLKVDGAGVLGRKNYKYTVSATSHGATKQTTVVITVIGKIDEVPGSQNASDAPTFNKIITSGHLLKPGDYFSLTIYPSTQINAVEIKSVIINLDGKTIKICDSEEVKSGCGANVGPFKAGDIGQHKYEFVLNGANGKVSKPWGKFWVQKGAVNSSYPDWEKIITNNNTINVGEKFTATVYAKNNPKIKRIDGYVDGKIIKSCSNTPVCEMTAGPYTKPGKHAYKFLIVAVNGKYTVAGAQSFFEVINKEDLIAPTVSISKDKLSANTEEQITFVANASDNKKVVKMQILINQKVAKECENTNECVFVGGPYSDKAGADIIYGANAFDAAGNYAWTGYSAVSIKAKLKDIVEPAVSVKASKSILAASDTIVLNASVDVGSKTLKYLKILVNQQDMKTCLTSACEYVAGPFNQYEGGTINFAATAHFTDGTFKTTGYTWLSVTSNPAIGITPILGSFTQKDPIGFWAVVNSGNKIFDHVDILLNQKIVKTCDNTNCKYNGSAYPAGTKIVYGATAFFKDGTSLFTGYNLFVIANAEPVVVSPAPAPTPAPTPTTASLAITSTKASIYGNDIETYTLKAKLDWVRPATKMYILVANGVVIYCNNATECSYTGGPYPAGNIGETVKFYAKAELADGTLVTSNIGELRVIAPPATDSRENQRGIQ